MRPDGANPSQGVVEITPSPISHLWVALVVGFGAAILAGSGILVLGEVLAALERPVLSALMVAR